MLIVRGDAQTLPSEMNKAATGEAWYGPIPPETDGVEVVTVVFSPNGRTVWHHHEHGQLVGAGDTVRIAPDERHWHGATSNTLMSHTTVTIGATQFNDAVTEADFAAANGVARA